MVGTDGYAPSTSRMSIEHSTNELCSLRSMVLDYPIVILISKLLFFWPQVLKLSFEKNCPWLYGTNHIRVDIRNFFYQKKYWRSKKQSKTQSVQGPTYLFHQGQQNKTYTNTCYISGFWLILVKNNKRQIHNSSFYLGLKGTQRFTKVGSVVFKFNYLRRFE